ncbi:MAG: SpoIIE family protein phosphatase [Terracidiphilus sp.]
MARCVGMSLLAAGVWVCGTLAAAQPATPPVPLADPQPAVHVTLGQAALPLNGPWKFTVGDSPIDSQTGKPLWANPGFDDSKWETVDLTPNGAFDPLSGLSGYVPGWSVRGHPGYWGYAWYRIRVVVQARPGQQLALAGPANVDDVYQVFANGLLLGQFGNFSRATPIAYYTQPMKFSLPSRGKRDGESDSDLSTQVLAFRVFMMPSTLTEVADVGGFHSAPVLGDASTVTAGYQISWLELVRGYAVSSMQIPLFAVMAVLAFTLILFDRTDKVYLWIGALFLLQAMSSALSTASSWTQTVSILAGQLLNDGLMTSVIYAGWAMVWWVWFGRQRPAWTPRAAVVLASLYLITIVVGQEMIVGLVPHGVAGAFLKASVLVRLLFLALQLWIVFQGIRRQGLEGWMVLPAVMLWGVGTFAAELVVLHVRIRWSFLGWSIRLNQVSNLLLLLVVGLLLLRRLLKSIHDQRLMALDVKQAQELQQVILPESRTALPGLIVESEYRPAREVGGDFFQIIPHKIDGSLLIVAGDVTGKGLKAGMLVALLVGAIRSTVDWSTDPMVILKALNQRLMGRNDAQATCLALRISSNGAVTLANAGHMAPYLSGEPIAMEGTLPLGMVEDAEISVMHFQLKPDDKLVLMSDGIAEATDADGHLFGFERVHELLRVATSAAEVANAAQSHGQEDDISVISVTRTSVKELAMA